MRICGAEVPSLQTPISPPNILLLTLTSSISAYHLIAMYHSSTPLAICIYPSSHDTTSPEKIQSANGELPFPRDATEER
jgi:hypothetical protein